MARRMLSDRYWKRIVPHLPGKRGVRGRPGANNRLAVEGILWIARTGAPWRDLPEEFGKWSTIYQRFRRWSNAGVLSQLFYLLAAALLDLRTVMVDGTYVKVHQHATGSPKRTDLPVVKPLAAAVEG